MARASARRPLPALVFLLALSLLTGLVWWRVIHRTGNDQPATAAPSCPPIASVTLVPQPAGVPVTVLNSTQRNGLARATSESLKKLGFPNPAYDNDPSGLVNGVAEIRYGPRAKAAATLVSFYFPGSSLVPVQRSDTGVIVSLGAKFTGVAGAPVVKQAIAAAHVSQVPAKPVNLAHGPTPRASSASASKSSSAHC
ncbi:MAG: LytR C-terminal domain-containing protein [Actinomycetota bacterium]